MTVSSFIAGDLFVFRIIKHHHDNPSDSWANSYEMVATISGAEADLLAAGLVLVAWEVAMHQNKVDFERLTISTWEEDSVPYNPEAFISVTLTDVGNVGPVTGFEPLNECLDVTRACPFGRFGHIFFRGALDASEVFAPGGKAALIDTTEIQGRIDDAISSSGLDAYIGVGSTEALSMAMVNKAGTQVRTVIGLHAGGISFLPLDHAWFNRTTGP